MIYFQGAFSRRRDEFSQFDHIGIEVLALMPHNL
jgi:hypothetical protein